MRKIVFFIVALSIAVSGCANLNRLARDEQKIPITTYEGKDDVTEAGAVYL
jgi:uncharacterized protein YceK